MARASRKGSVGANCSDRPKSCMMAGVWLTQVPLGVLTAGHWSNMSGDPSPRASLLYGRRPAGKSSRTSLKSTCNHPAVAVKEARTLSGCGSGAGCWQARQIENKGPTCAPA